MRMFTKILSRRARNSWERRCLISCGFMTGSAFMKGTCRDTRHRTAVSGCRAPKQDGSSTRWRSEHRSGRLDEKELGGRCERAKRRMGETAKAQRLTGRKTLRAE